MYLLKARGKKALQVLAKGGQIIVRLEPDYFGHEKWRYRLQDKDGTYLPFGVNTFYDLKDGAYLTLLNSTSVSQYYGLRS